MRHTDRVFLYTVITFWVIALLMGATLGLQYYNEVKEKIDLTVEEMDGKFLSRGEYTCMQKEGEDRDVCLLVLAMAYKQYNMPSFYMQEMCGSMESDFYKFVCYRSAG